MKAFLMHADQDVDFDQEPRAGADALTQDLNLDTVVGAMASGDPFLSALARRALLASLRHPAAIVYRQQALNDCLTNPDAVRAMYALCGEALDAQRRVWGSLGRDSPSTLLGISVNKMKILVGFLVGLRDLAGTHVNAFSSPAFARCLAMLIAELDPDYLRLVDDYLDELSLKGGMLVSAQLTAGNKTGDITLRRGRAQSRLERLLDRSGRSFTVPDRDEAGYRALRDLQDRGLNHVANALAQSLDHVLSFFTALRVELGFYVACLNLNDALESLGAPMSFPTVAAANAGALSGSGLFDIALALTMRRAVIGNDLAADGRSVLMITGANRGGKSTLLRSIGLAQLMMQAGMFVAAASFSASPCDGLFTHFKREEDEELQSGKLDEELARMSAIADHIRPGALLLCNESFASTNEREGSEIARQVVGALRDAGVRVVFVTHLFDLADGFYRERSEATLFLRAERPTGGDRTYKLTEGRPLATSFGEHLYREIFSAVPVSSAPVTGVRTPVTLAAACATWTGRPASPS
jgi:hypothetical protein